MPVIDLRTNKRDRSRQATNAMIQQIIQQKMKDQILSRAEAREDLQWRSEQDTKARELTRKMLAQGYSAVAEGDPRLTDPEQMKNLSPVQIGDKTTYYAPPDLEMKQVYEVPGAGAFYQQYTKGPDARAIGKPEWKAERTGTKTTAELYMDLMNQGKVKEAKWLLEAKRALPGEIGQGEYERRLAQLETQYGITSQKEKAELEIKQKEAFPKIQKNYDKQMQDGKYLDGLIDEAIDLVGPLTAGPAALISMVPGTPQFELAESLKAIAANVSFTRLNEMRAASPTGGALGQVSNFENELLQAVLGSMKQGLPHKTLKQNLIRIKEHLKKVQQGTTDWYNQYYGGFTSETMPEETAGNKNLKRKKLSEY